MANHEYFSYVNCSAIDIVYKINLRLTSVRVTLTERRRCEGGLRIEQSPSWRQERGCCFLATMDNTPFLLDRREDEESAALVSIAEAAAMGARNAVLEKVHLAEEAAVAGMEVGAGAGEVPPMVAGLLPLSRAVQKERSKQCMLPFVSCHLRHANWCLALTSYKSRLQPRQELLQTRTLWPPLQVLGPGQPATTWSAPYQEDPRSINGLPGFPLGASLALAAGVYPRFTSSSDTVVSVLYGGLVLLIFMLMVGIVAVPFRSMSPETVSRHVTFASFTTLIVLLTVVLCTLLSGEGFIVSVGVLGGLASLSLIYLWLRSNRYYRTG
ncbi:uncharacterized protein [Miscanthus floridulus]|uniref:uncharacterized protein n=1 Tax=Miscanthus floridulus TaxID=154761 RepID=UPI003458A76B